MSVKEHVVGTGLTLGNLEDMAVGDKAKVRSIDQNAPIEMYTNLKKGLGTHWNFIKQHERETGRKYNLSIKLNKPGRRYLLVERVA